MRENHIAAYRSGFGPIPWVLGLLAWHCAGAALRAEETAQGEKTETAAAARATPAARRPAVRIVVLKGTYVDSPTGSDLDPVSLVLGGLEQPGSFFEVCDKLDDLAKDEQIQHVLFDLSSPTLQLNLAQLAELPRHIRKLKAAGKGTIAWLENADTVHYALASACDKILMTELGSLDLPSLSLTTLHFRDAMELLGAKASFVRTGDFKGAVEPFTLSEMSEPLRRHYREMLVSMNDSLVTQISAGRGLSREEVRRVQSDRWFTPRAALQAKLVDQVVASGAQRQSVGKLLGQGMTWVEPQKAKAKPLSFFELMGKLMGGLQESRVAKPSIAVLHLDGPIMDGTKEMPGWLVAGPFVKAIEELGSEEAVRGVVVRINSPGGSASASEAIRAALARLAAKKAVVFSLGDVAASGGYWVCCVGRPVYAEPATLTGSIGVFALKLSLGPFLKKIGINVQSVTLDESASAMGIERAWTPAETTRMQGFVDDVYDRFLKLVADSRKLPVQQVAPIAGGRVWSGAQALKLGLVDQLGGLGEAVAAVASQAGVAPGYSVIHRPRKKTFFEMFDLFDESPDQIRSRLSPDAWRWLRQAGFDLNVPLHLLRESLAGAAPKVWLLSPTELVIRY